MKRQLLALVLATTQFASWGAAPLYLCVGAEGSISIDQGHEHCTACCPSDEEPTACDSHSGCCPAHDNNADWQSPAHDMPLASRSCDCLHVQIISQQGPIVVRPKGMGPVERLAIQHLATDYGLPLGDPATREPSGPAVAGPCA